MESKNERKVDPADKTYFGGKAGNGTYQTIINQIRPHEIYIEPFLGGGAVYHRKKKAEISVLVDKDWKCVARARRAILKKGYQLTYQYLENDYYKVSDDGTSKVYMMVSDALEALDYYVFLVYPEPMFRKCVYLDPPYPLQSRKSSDRNRYRFELTDEDHIRLLHKAKSLPCDVLISTYPNELYRKELEGWRLIEFQSMTHAGMATEWLFCNYPEPTELHDYRYVGKDNRERLDFARMKDRWRTRLLAMPPQKRNAMLEYINGIHAVAGQGKNASISRGNS